MNNKERYQLAEWVNNIARKQGASDTAISISRSRSVSVEVREQKIETIKESTENNLNLQIYRDNKFSSHSTNNLKKNDLERFVREAVEATKYLSEDPDRALPDPDLYPKGQLSDLEIYDMDHASVTPEFRVESAMKLEALIRDGYPDVISSSASFSDNVGEGIRFHSNGFRGEFSGTFFGSSAGMTIMDKGSRPAGGFWGGNRFLKNLPSAEEVASKAIADTIRQIGQGSIASGRYTMIIENSNSSQLLWRLIQPMSARAIQQRSSFLVDMLGKSIGSELLTVIDDPTIKGGMASRHFDGEGIGARRRVLIENGILNEYLIDNYYGRKLGVRPNGGSTSNIFMANGKRSPEQIIADTKKGILVTSFNGGNSNSTTGDFSFGISGQLIENGKIVRAVNEMNISGNFRNLFNQLIETGNDPYRFSSAQTPTLVFRDVDFSGL